MEGAMRWKIWLAAAGGVVVVGAVAIAAQQGGQPQATPAPPDPVQILVDRLDLEKYKATIKGLTQFGDRREGTQRNRDAVAWIEAQLKSYGCQTEGMTYARTSRGGVVTRGGGGGGAAAGGGAAGAAGGGAAGAGAEAAGGAGGAAAAGQQGRGGQTGQAAAGQQAQ